MSADRKTTKKTKSPEFVVSAGPKSLAIQFITGELGMDGTEGVKQLRDAYRKVALERGMWREKLMAEVEAVSDIRKELVSKDTAWGVVTGKQLINLCITCAKNPAKFGGGWGQDEVTKKVKAEDTTTFKLVFLDSKKRTTKRYSLSPIQLRILRLLSSAPEAMPRSAIGREVSTSLMTPEIGPSVSPGLDPSIMVRDSEEEHGRPSLLGMGLIKASMDPNPVNGKEVVLYSLTKEGEWVLEVLDEVK